MIFLLFLKRIISNLYGSCSIIKMITFIKMYGLVFNKDYSTNKHLSFQLDLGLAGFDFNETLWCMQNLTFRTQK